jgi:hypothetical protein
MSSKRYVVEKVCLGDLSIAKNYFQSVSYESMQIYLAEESL